MPNPLGINGREERAWSDAIRRALARAEHDPKRGHATLNALAERLIDKASEGDMPALKEFGDRVEGKVPQAHEHTGQGGGPIQAKVTVEFVGAGAGSIPVPVASQG